MPYENPNPPKRKRKPAAAKKAVWTDPFIDNAMSEVKKAKGRQEASYMVCKTLVRTFQDHLRTQDLPAFYERIQKEEPKAYMTLITKLSPNATEQMNIDNYEKLQLLANEQNKPIAQVIDELIMMQKKKP